MHHKWINNFSAMFYPFTRNTNLDLEPRVQPVSRPNSHCRCKWMDYVSRTAQRKEWSMFCQLIEREWSVSLIYTRSSAHIFFHFFAVHRDTDKLHCYEQKNHKKTKKCSTRKWFYFLIFFSKNPNSHGNKPKVTPIRPVGVSETFASTVSLQGSDDTLNVKISTMVDTRLSEIMEKNV